ncbi:GNAT family N-acetyltransferase [Oceanobacillus kapialis]|uniref:GNAT family N-acetyltransferase n=1 Tax=Oceanobacillus kapialis TaxID=481353 RepID=UPI00384C11F2
MNTFFRTSNFGPFTIRQATPGDATAVIELLKGVAKRLHERGINQWEFLLRDEEDSEIVAAIDRGVSYIVTDGNSLVATFNLTNKQNAWDQTLWGAPNEENAFYIHRLAVHSDYTGRGIGRDLLLWFEENINAESGLLRLDCIANNPVLNTFYKQTGFQYIGQALAEGDSFSLYEKQLPRTSNVKSR